MWNLCYTILLVCIIDNRYWTSANAIDFLSLSDKNWILNVIQQQENWNMTVDQVCHPDSSNKINKTNIYCPSKHIISLTESFNQLNQNLNIGEKFELNTKSISITLEKVSSNNLTDKHLLQSTGAEIRFPELNLNKNITINLMTIPSSSILSLTLHDQSVQIINIKNTTKPFEIMIPRQKNIIMPKMFYQNIKLFSKNSQFKYYHINLTHQINLSISLHIEIQSENPELSYLFIIRFNGVPDLQRNLIDDWKLLCSKDRENHTRKYRHFIDNTQISTHQWAIVGIREMKECKYNSINNNIRFSSNYSMGIYTSGCYYLDNNNNWQSDGLTVGAKTNEYFTQCYSTHLTTYAGGFAVLPQPLDFNNVDLDIKKNLTIYLTLIIIGLLYLFTLIYSYYKDKIDARKLMVIPLKDNNQNDTYLYQLVVFTGMRANAGTKSKVYFILSGNDDDTNVRTLTADRRIFDRGNVDSFIMAVPRSLGQLNYLRIWHDNSGLDSSASWYLKYVLIRDLQTIETSYFICEKWLAVEKGSGDIVRTITIAGELEKNELKHMLSKNAYRSMADNHLWFSVFAYHLPSANRFTRIQRCTCCFVLLLMSLLVNLFFYREKSLSEDDDGDEPEQYGIKFGPFHISQTEISIGVMSELIIFFPSLILVALFRRSKEHHTQIISPVGQAIQNIQTKNFQEKYHLIKKKRFLFPWWCRILAYILSVLIVGTSITFILLRGAQYGDVVVRQWLGSILISFCASVLLTQPMKVFSLAILFLCLCRKKAQAEAFLDEEDPIEDFTISRKDPHRKFPPKSLLAKTRLDPYRSKREKAALKKLRELRLQEIKAWFILRELFFLLLFLGILYAISFANRDVENAHHMVDYLRREFLQVDYHHQFMYNTKGGKFVFENIRTIEDYWKWLEDIFIKKYMLTRWIDDKQMNISILLQSNRTNRNISWPILRQLRVKNDSCPRKVLNDLMKVDDCNLPYTWYNEAKTPFGHNISFDDLKISQAFQYSSAEDKTLIYSTAYATYMSGGYIHEMKGNKIDSIKQDLKNLHEHHWIDRYTRAIFLTFGLYNPNVNLFVYCSLLLEQLPTTFEIVLRPSFQPFKLVQLYTGTDLIYCLVYLILILYYMYTELKLIFQMGKKYLKQFWSYINWGIIICSWFGVAIHIYRQTEMKKMIDSLEEKNQTFVHLQFFSYLDSLLTYLLGFCCFFGTIKILRLLRFNRRMSLLHLTLEKSARQLFGFFLVFSLVFIAFTSLFYLLFHAHLLNYSTWFETAFTCIEMISIHFTTVPDLNKTNPFIAGLCLFLFIFLAVFLLRNMFISIIVDNFNSIRREQLKRANEVELIQFLTEKMKRLFEIRSRKEEMEKKKNPVKEFPNKLDKLIIAIDKAYKNKKY